jgi:hypothetical protein
MYIVSSVTLAWEASESRAQDKFLFGKDSREQQWGLREGEKPIKGCAIKLVTAMFSSARTLGGADVCRMGQLRDETGRLNCSC